MGILLGISVTGITRHFLTPIEMHQVASAYELNKENAGHRHALYFVNEKGLRLERLRRETEALR